MTTGAIAAEEYIQTDVPIHPAQARPTTFFEQVVAATPGTANLERCIQCGTCSGSCPSGPDMEYTPRAMFAMIAAGMREKVLQSNTQWFCVSCYYCMVRCPQDVHITDIMYTLKRFSVREGYAEQSSAPEAPGFSKSFIYYLENYGRSFEFGLATRHHLTQHPLGAVKMAPMGLGMWVRGRMDLTPRRIKNLDQFKAIIAKAKEMEDAEMEAYIP